MKEKAVEREDYEDKDDRYILTVDMKSHPSGCLLHKVTEES